MLEEMKWNVHAGSDVPFVFESCVAHRPSLVIVDLEMRGAIGFDCIGTARRLFPDLFIIAISRGSDDKLWPAASAICGANRFVKGPVSILTLSEAIDSGVTWTR
jgi:DNA-binding NarL/FixJ family response regulator